MPRDVADQPEPPGPLTLTAVTPAATTTLAAALARVLQGGDLLGLTGELGAGKTHFVRGLAQGLGINPAQVSSPTFVLLHEYTPPATPPTPATAPNPKSEIRNSKSCLPLAHLDLYRLGGVEELETLGWGEAGDELRRDAIVAVEWADRFPEAMGSDWLEIELAHGPGDGRTITITPHGAWRPRMADVSRRLQATLGGANTPRVSDHQASPEGDG